MNTNILESFRCWTLLLCCMLLTAAHAQDVKQPDTVPDSTASGSTTTFSSDEDHDSASDEDHGRDEDWSTSHHSNRHHGHGGSEPVVSIGRKADLPAGQHADSVVAIFGSATSAGDVDDAVVSVLGSTHVTGKVGDSAVAVMGSVYVNGEVNGDVVAVMGNVELGPEAKVHGDVVVVGGELTRDPKATVDGHVQNVFGVEWADFDWLRPWVERCLLYGRPLAFAPGLGWAWGIALGLLALYLFIAFVFRSAVDKCVQTLETEAGHSILAALLLTLGIPVLFVLLFITVLGIAAVPFLAIAVICAAVFGKVVVLAAIGRRCTPMLANDPTVHTVVGVLVGGLIAMVLYTIPVVGFIVYKLLELLGLGVVVYTLLVSVRAGRQARAAGGGGNAGPGGGFMPGGGAGPAGGTGAGIGGGAGSAGAADARFAGGAGSPGGFAGDGGAGAAGAAGAGFGGGAGAAGSGGGAAHDGDTSFGAGPGFAGGSGPAGAAMGVGGAGARGSFDAASEAAGPGAAPGHGPSTSGQGPSSTSGNGPGSAGGGPPPYTTPGSTGQPPLNVAALPRAGFGIRMGALLLDVVLIGILLNQLHERVNIELLALAAYGAVMWKLKASTIGGIICGLQVVRLDGRPIDWPTAIVRALGCFLSLAVVGLGFIWIAIDNDKQSWHDKIAGTVVVRAPKGASLL
jgi:uncharacterized RDD family membrane protein YckC